MKKLQIGQIESKVVRKAKDLKFLTYKLASQSNKGAPDRIFISPYGEVFFMKFKSEKAKLTQVQKKVIKDMDAYEVEVFVVDYLEFGLEILAVKNGDVFEC